MQMALKNVEGPVDYINAHGTSTPVGDTIELEGIREVFKNQNAIPPISSTKSLSGHSQGATGVHEAIYTLLMMKHNFIAASANIEKVDPEVEDMPIVRERVDGASLRVAMSNSFGFGGTNVVLAFQKFDVR